jgi:putative membrane protein
MTATQSNLASLSRFIFRTPRWYTSLTFAVAVAGVTGIAAFETRYLLEDAWQGIFFIAMPTIAASVLTSVVDGRLGGRLSPNRSSLLALACEMVVVTVLLVAGIVAVAFPFPEPLATLSPIPEFTGMDLGQNFVFDGLLVGLAGIFALRLLVIMSVSEYSSLVAVVPASIQTVVAGAFLFVYSGTIRYMEVGGPILRAYLARQDETHATLAIQPSDFLLLAVLSLAYGLAAVAFVKVIDRPWQRSLGVSVLDFVRGFVGHIAEDSRELENFFEEIGEEAVVPVTVMSVRTRPGQEKARFVLPMIHPGPMGDIGGGNLPRRVAEASEGLSFPPHATAGHDFNLVTEREVDTILEAADTALDRVEYHDAATPSIRASDGDAKVLGQAVGDGVVLVSTWAPRFADDVDYAVGLSAAAEARSSGFDDVLLVDAHNCNDGLEGEDLGHVVPGSTRSFQLMQAAATAADRLNEAERKPLQVGTAWTPTDWRPRDGIGPLGVRVAAFDVGGHVTAYVLVDGNNMEPGVRDRLVDRILALEEVDETEVMTTDTHVVNQVDATNQVGENLDLDRLIEVVTGLTREALDDRERVEAGVATEHARVTVFGNDRTETLASHANAMVSMGGALAAAVGVAAVAVSALVFLLVP